MSIAYGTLLFETLRERERCFDPIARAVAPPIFIRASLY
jgi:hypothetical protein